MDIPLREKYRTLRPTMGYPAKARTGNSHGGTKTRKKTGKGQVQRQRVMLVDGFRGTARMVDA